MGSLFLLPLVFLAIAVVVMSGNRHMATQEESLLRRFGVLQLAEVYGVYVDPEQHETYVGYRFLHRESGKVVERVGIWRGTLDKPHTRDSIWVLYAPEKPEISRMLNEAGFRASDVNALQPS